MSVSLHGMGVSRGIAIGNVHIIKRDQLEIVEYKIAEDNVDTEISRLKDAVTQAKRQLRAIRDHIPESTTADIAAFIDTHLLMMEDAALTQEPVRLIRSSKCNAEWALKLQRDALVAAFDEMLEDTAGPGWQLSIPRTQFAEYLYSASINAKYGAADVKHLADRLQALRLSTLAVFKS